MLVKVEARAGQTKSTWSWDRNYNLGRFRQRRKRFFTKTSINPKWFILLRAGRKSLTGKRSRTRQETAFRVKPVWHQFKTTMHHKNQKTHGRFEPFHCVAVDTRVLPWRRYYRQLQFDRQMKNEKQQNILLITSQRDTEADTQREPAGLTSPAQVYLHISHFWVWSRFMFLDFNLRRSRFSSALKQQRGFSPAEKEKWK